LATRRLGLFLGIAPLVIGAMAFGACGDDDDGGGGSRSGSDEEFVADLCAAMKQFDEDITKVFSDPSAFEDEDEAVEALSEPMRNLANAFEDARVPNDLRDWHEKASKALNDTVDKLESGDFDESTFEDDPFEDPPQDAVDRLQKLAEDNEDCQDADFDFEG